MFVDYRLNVWISLTCAILGGNFIELASTHSQTLFCIFY